jgi:DNA-binding NarL/FixJ family response regulator
MKREYFNVGGFSLTRHEMRITALLCMGHDRYNMSLHLGNCVGTLKNEITLLFRKTHTTKATELVAFAIKQGFDTEGSWKGQSFL